MSIFLYVYLDESYINSNHRKSMEWIDMETGEGRKTKSGKGARWILLGKQIRTQRQK